MRVRQPGVERRKPDLGAVADEEKHEGERHHARVEAGGVLRQQVPRHRGQALAHHFLRGEIDQNGAEEGEADADAAEDEILPRRLDRGGRAIDADHHHGRERCDLDADPHQADIVGEQRDAHRPEHRLEHGVIEAQERRRDAADLDLVRDIGGAEDRGGEADEIGQHDEEDVEVVDDDELAAHARAEQQGNAGRQGERAGDHVEHGAEPIVAHEGEHHHGDRGHPQQHLDGQSHDCSLRSPRKLSSALTSTVSKRSRMRKTKTPNTMKAIRIEKATENSTTSGMPLAPVAASTRPFSSDMKPTIWVTALRRVIIIRSPSSTIASAKARSSRTMMPVPSPTGCTRRIDSATRPRPVSMVRPPPSTCSTSRWMASRRTIRCSAGGMMKPFTTSATSAVTIRCGALCATDCQATDSASAIACSANTLSTAVMRSW